MIDIEFCQYIGVDEFFIKLNKLFKNSGCGNRSFFIDVFLHQTDKVNEHATFRLKGLPEDNLPGKVFISANQAYLQFLLGQVKVYS